MKKVEIENDTRPLSELLSQENGTDVIYLTRKGRAKYAIVPLDKDEQEMVNMRANGKLMAYLDGCHERARTRPRKSLEEIKAKYEGRD